MYIPLKEISLCCFLIVSCPVIVFGFEEAVMSLENLWDDHVETLSSRRRQTVLNTLALQKVGF